jgi:hypothetical protein
METTGPGSSNLIKLILRDPEQTDLETSKTANKNSPAQPSE